MHHSGRRQIHAMGAAIVERVCDEMRRLRRLQDSLLRIAIFSILLNGSSRLQVVRLRVDSDFHFAGNCLKSRMTNPAISWRKIAITLIDRGCECKRLSTTDCL